MKLRNTLAHLSLCVAACALCVGGAHASARMAGGQTPKAKGAAARRSAAARAARKQTPAAKSKPASQNQPAAKETALTPAAKKTPAERPQVKELDEAALKALLDEHKQGGRRLLINFWATWCTPCREEFPDLVKIKEEFGGRQDFEFITISLDDISEITKAVPDFLSETGAASIPAYLSTIKDPEAVIALIDKGWFGDLPATFLFGRDGALVFRHTGRVKPDALRKAIQDSDQ